jgi:hypothetical protein
MADPIFQRLPATTGSWRDVGDGDLSAVLAVLSASEHPPPAFVGRLAHEYGLKDELDGRSVARPLGLVRQHGRTILLLEDPGEASRSTGCSDPWKWEGFGSASRLPRERQSFEPPSSSPGHSLTWRLNRLDE